ncbi:hypothetical protein ACN47E_007528 [Coniothyrium glycines]
MDSFEKKTLRTSRGLLYTYYTADGESSLPALCFLHGWPDHAAMWQKVAEPLRSTRHPIIIPDLLGYDGTDKPTDVTKYKWDVMIPDLVEIIDAERHSKVISIGHDWGSGAASRLYNYFPDRVAGLINLNVPYMAPARQPFDLDSYNSFTEKTFGHPLLSYWSVFAAPDGPSLLEKNLDRIYHAMHGSGGTMLEMFTKPNALREFLTSEDKFDIELRVYAQDPGFKKSFIDRMARDGFEGPQKWYVATNENHQHEADKNLPEGVDTVKVPVLYIGAKQDPVCRPEGLIPSIQAGLLPELEQAEMIDAGHWVPYEKPQEVADRIESWLKKHFSKN